MKISCELPLLQPNSWHWESIPWAQLVLNMALKGHTQGTTGSRHVFPILPEKCQKPVRIYVQTLTLHPAVIYGGSKTVTTEKGTQTEADRLIYAVSKTCWCLVLCSVLDRRTQGTSSMPEEHLVYLGSNPSNNSINCMAELLLLEKFKQKETQQVPKNIISLHRWLLGQQHKKLPWIVLLY